MVLCLCTVGPQYRQMVVMRGAVVVWMSMVAVRGMVVLGYMVHAAMVMLAVENVRAVVVLRAERNGAIGSEFALTRMAGVQKLSSPRLARALRRMRFDVEALEPDAFSSHRLLVILRCFSKPSVVCDQCTTPKNISCAYDARANRMVWADLVIFG
jgi:hypothetical protein